MSEGVDVSAYQHPGGAVIDWSAVANWLRSRGSGAFAFIKASEGANRIEPYYARDITSATQNGLSSGPYHFWRYDQDNYLQANEFLRVVGNAGPFGLGIGIDAEPIAGVPVPDWRVLAAKLGAFCSLIHNARPKDTLYVYVDGEWRDKLTPYGFPWGYKTWGALWKGDIEQTGQGTVPGIQGEVDLDEGNVGLVTTEGDDMQSRDSKDGSFIVVDPAGEVFTFNANGTPGGHYLGGLNTHPEWNAGAGKAEGAVVAVNHYDDGGPFDAYVIVTRDSQGGWHGYNFPSNGSAKGA